MIRMSGQDSNSGPMSEAGLVRYFDSHSDKSITIDPKALLAFAIFLGGLIEIVNLFI